MYFENPERMLEFYNLDSLSLSAHSYSGGGGLAGGVSRINNPGKGISLV